MHTRRKKKVWSVMRLLSKLHEIFCCHTVSRGNPHSEFADECILRDPDLEMYFFGSVHAVDNTAGDDSGGIAIGHSGVDVEAVDVPILLEIYTTKHNTADH